MKSKIKSNEYNYLLCCFIGLTFKTQYATERRESSYIVYLDKFDQQMVTESWTATEKKITAFRCINIVHTRGP